MNEYSKILEAIIKEAKSVDGAFGQLLNSSINIAEGIRTTASDSHNHLREFLGGEHDRDAAFPCILSKKDNDFLGGSFARHTKIWPLDDIDIYFPLDGYNLVYLQNGNRLPYTVVSDGTVVTNPLLNSRWMEGSYISSVKVVAGFASVLKRHYPNTVVKPDGQSVALKMTQGETSEEEGLGYDIVPCFSMQPDDKTQKEFYLMPDGKNGWMRTNPRIDKEIAEDLNVKNNKTYKKVVKILKYWNKERLNSALLSYYIELAIARAYLGRNSLGEKINKISYGVALGFEAVKNAMVKGDQSSFLPQSPSVRPGVLTDFNQQHIIAASAISSRAWNEESTGNEIAAKNFWKKLFGDSFGE